MFDKSKRMTLAQAREGFMGAVSMSNHASFQRRYLASLLKNA